MQVLDGEVVSALAGRDRHCRVPRRTALTVIRRSCHPARGGEHRSKLGSRHHGGEAASPSGVPIRQLRSIADGGAGAGARPGFQFHTAQAMMAP